MSILVTGARGAIGSAVVDHFVHLGEIVIAQHLDTTGLHPAMIRGAVELLGAEVQLADDVLGYLRASEISRDRVEDARNVLKEGDEVSA